MKFNVEQFRAWEHKKVTLLGMSGVGKSYLSTMLRDGSNWFHYSGDYRIEGDTIQGKVAVTRYNQNIISVFGNLDQFSLSFSGQIKKDSMEAAASFDNMPELKVKIICKKKVDL